MISMTNPTINIHTGCFNNNLSVSVTNLEVLGVSRPKLLKCQYQFSNKLHSVMPTITQVSVELDTASREKSLEHMFQMPTPVTPVEMRLHKQMLLRCAVSHWRLFVKDWGLSVAAVAA
jgi:hypothetical protein